MNLNKPTSVQLYMFIMIKQSKTKLNCTKLLNQTKLQIKSFMVYSFMVRKSHSKSSPLYRDLKRILSEGKFTFFF